MRPERIEVLQGGLQYLSENRRVLLDKILFAHAGRQQLPLDVVDTGGSAAGEDNELRILEEIVDRQQLAAVQGVHGVLAAHTAGIDVQRGNLAPRRNQVIAGNVGKGVEHHLAGGFWKVR